MFAALSNRVLNPFIEKNSSVMQSLFERLAVVPYEDINSCFATDSRGIFSDVKAAQLQNDLSMVRTGPLTPWW